MTAEPTIETVLRRRIDEALAAPMADQNSEALDAFRKITIGGMLIGILSAIDYLRHAEGVRFQSLDDLQAAAVRIAAESIGLVAGPGETRQ